MKPMLLTAFVILLAIVEAQLGIPIQLVETGKKREHVNYTDVSDPCPCDRIKNLCDTFCCCDPLCQQQTTCTRVQQRNYLKYPQCQSSNSDEFYLNEINDIMCVVFERLPYSGQYKNIVTGVNAKTDKLTFDKDSSFFLYQILNDTQQEVNADSHKYSGNPGYRIGLPLMLGLREGDVINWIKPLKIQAWKADRSCSLISEASLNDIQVNFGQDISIQCSIPLASFSTYCTGDTSAFKIFNNLNSGSTFFFVGRWGSSRQVRINEWVQIKNQAITVPNSQAGYCTGVYTKQLTVYYHKTGNVGDLQNHIIDVFQTDIPNYVYLTSRQISLTLTFKINFVEITNFEAEPSSTLSIRDSIAPYVKRVFRPFTHAIPLALAALLLLLTFI